VKVHPLYAQLAHLDEDMQALQLKSVGPNVAQNGADIARAERQLQGALDAAAERTKKALNGKQQEYMKREQAAINAAVGATAGAGNGGAGIAGSVAQNARLQERDAAQLAQKNFDAYRQQVANQSNAAARSLQRSLAGRADRTYRSKAEDLSKREADFALQEETDDAAQRLSLRTKLSNLALDDDTRADVKKQLDALDRKEADAIGALKNRDAETLANLQRELHEQVQTELNVQVAALRKRTLAKIDERGLVTRRQLVAQLGVPATGGGVAVPNGIGRDMRSKLQALHQQYQKQFDRDASQTIAQFEKTRADLTKRFQQIAGIDANAQAGANREMGALQKQRGDLYNEMVAQIGREVKAVAEKRGINVVVSDVVAPAGGVDLTADAEKDIESLHE
ncbi:MAG: OmpH family outer membrane protein, partial [Candidatus Eremiobacteraeota bacterium]|nr:OmpH family outer membrane protein [Candidatus Eremiobacteraeota bacterium]